MIDIVYSDLNEVRRSYQDNGVMANRPLWFSCVLLLWDMRMTIRINVVPLDYFWRPSSDPNSTLPLIDTNKHRTRRLRPPGLTLHPTFSIYGSHIDILIGLERIKASLSVGDVVCDADCRQSRCRKGLCRHRRQPESRFSDRHRTWKRFPNIGRPLQRGREYRRHALRIKLPSRKPQNHLLLTDKREGDWILMCLPLRHVKRRSITYLHRNLD